MFGLLSFSVHCPLFSGHRLNALYKKSHWLASCFDRRQHFPGASMKKMYILIITLVFGVHGGRIISGVISAANRWYGTATAQVLLELRLQRLHPILWKPILLVKRHLKVNILTSFPIFILGLVKSENWSVRFLKLLKKGKLCSIIFSFHVRLPCISYLVVINLAIVLWTYDRNADTSGGKKACYLGNWSSRWLGFGWGPACWGTQEGKHEFQPLGLVSLIDSVL